MPKMDINCWGLKEALVFLDSIYIVLLFFKVSAALIDASVITKFELKSK